MTSLEAESLIESEMLEPQGGARVEIALVAHDDVNQLHKNRWAGLESLIRIDTAALLGFATSTFI